MKISKIGSWTNKVSWNKGNRTRRLRINNDMCRVHRGQHGFLDPAVDHSSIPSSHKSLSPLAWLPCLELCSRDRGSYTSLTPLHCWIFGLSSSSSAALLDRSPGDVHTPYVGRTTEVLPFVALVFIDCSSTQPWGRCHLSLSTTIMRQRLPCYRSSRVWTPVLLCYLTSA
jgi:hypothetical protein